VRNPSIPRHLAALVALLFAACQAAPPTYEVASEDDMVRADSPFLATRVAGILGRTRNQVLELVPDSTRKPLEVWLQDELHLYRFRRGSYEHADGFWAEGAGRIHLRTEAHHLERTLVHELVHSSLDDTWSVLPGTLEEGLCDWVSTRICPYSSARLRAGRLSAACLGLGSLEIQIELRAAHADGTAQALGSYARILLEGDIDPPVSPCDVFQLQAGRSDSGLSGPRKKALYGLAFFLIDRIATHDSGLGSLHALCVRARSEGLPEVPTEWLLEAAGLEGLDALQWKPGLADAFTGAELAELVAMYPEFLGSAIDRLPIPSTGGAGTDELRFAMRVNPR